MDRELNHNLHSIDKGCLINVGAAFVILFVAVGCSRKSAAQQHSSVISSSAKVQVQQIQNKYGVVVVMRGHQIIVGTPYVPTKEETRQVDNALRKAFGNNFTNYTVVHTVN